MEGSPIVRGMERPKKLQEKLLKKNLDLNSLTIDMVHDKTPWRHLIHVIESGTRLGCCYCCCRYACGVYVILSLLFLLEIHFCF